MSVDQNYCVIVGFDLTKYKTDKYNDWRWTDDGEEFTCYQSKGHIQLFDDPMSGRYLYFGYIIAKGDQYEFDTVKFNPIEIDKLYLDIRQKLKHLIDVGVVNLDTYRIDYELIIFEEYT